MFELYNFFETNQFLGRVLDTGSFSHKTVTGFSTAATGPVALTFSGSNSGLGASEWAELEMKAEPKKVTL